MIFVADDFGFSPSTNAAILELAAAGAIDGASVLMTGPSADGIAQLARHPGVKVGLHLSLTWGRAVSDPAGLGALVDGQGRFHALSAFARRLLARRIEMAALRTEIEAQLEALLRCAGRVDYVDGHQHVHVVPLVFETLNEILGTGRFGRCRVRFGTMADGPLVRRGLFNTFVGYQHVRRRLGRVTFHFDTAATVRDLPPPGGAATDDGTEAMLHVAHPDVPEPHLDGSTYDFQSRVDQFRRLLAARRR